MGVSVSCYPEDRKQHMEEKSLFQNVVPGHSSQLTGHQGRTLAAVTTSTVKSRRSKCTHVARVLSASFVLSCTVQNPRPWNGAIYKELSHINQQSRKAPKDVATGNPDLDLDSPLI